MTPDRKVSLVFKDYREQPVTSARKGFKVSRETLGPKGRPEIPVAFRT